MSKEINYRIWCEWDIGQDDYVFTSKAQALEWCEDNIHLAEIIADPAQELENVNAVIEAGLLSILQVTVYGI